MSLTKTNRFVLAAIGLTVALAFFAAVAVVPAQAQTVDELQAQIAALLAQIQALQAQIGGGTPAPVGACTFTRSLTIGVSGADVTCLQNYLMSTGHFTFAGGATGYFGPITQSAVAAWQASNGVAPAAGYFGPISQAKYNSLAGGVTPGTPGTPGQCPAGYTVVPLDPAGFQCVMDGGTPTPPAGPVVSDGILITSTLSLESTPADGTDLKKGDTNKALAKWKIRPSGSDGKLIQFGIKTDHRPWLYWSSARLVDGSGNVIAEKTGLTESDFTEATAGSDYRLIFGNLNHNLPKDTNNYVTLEVTSPLNNDRAAVSDLVIDQASNSVIIQDANDPGYTVSDGITADRKYDFKAGTTGNVVPSLSESSPENRWVKITTTGTTPNVELMKFNLKAEQRNIKIESLEFAVHNSKNTATTTLLNSLDLYDGNDLVGSVDLSTGVVDDLNINIVEDTIKTLRLVAEVADADDLTLGIAASTTLLAQVSDGIGGIDTNVDAVTVSGSTVISNNTHFTTTVANVSNASATVTPVPDKPAQATVQYVFSMTADGGDIFVSKTTATALATSSSFTANGGAGTSTITAVTASNTHPSDTTTYWAISPGTTRTFTYTGSMDNTAIGGDTSAGVKNFKITNVYWDDDTSGFQEFNTDFGLENLEINHFLST